MPINRTASDKTIRTFSQVTDSKPPVHPRRSPCAVLPSCDTQRMSVASAPWSARSRGTFAATGGWRLGPEYAKSDKNIPRPVDQISAGQAAHMIPRDRPGGGNVLLFDDQGPSGITPVPLDIFKGSRVIEIDPVTRQIVWQYVASDSGQPAYAMHTFYGGNAERLPNGNTLINAGFRGRVFQMTRAMAGLSGECCLQLIGRS